MGAESAAMPSTPMSSHLYSQHTRTHTHAHTHSVPLCLSVCLTLGLILSLSVSFTHILSLSLSLSPSQHVCLALSPVIRGSEGLRGETRAQIKIKDRRTMQKMENRLILKESQITVKEEDKAVLCVCVCVCVCTCTPLPLMTNGLGQPGKI